MATASPFEADQQRANARRLVAPAIVLTALGMLAWLIYSSFDNGTVVRRQAPPTTTIDLLPPPPPPPPLPQEEPPPEPVEDQVQDVPSPAPEPAPEAPAPLSIDAPATAGTDSFGIRSGSGGGMGAPGSLGTCVGPNCGGGGGGGISDASYRNYMSAILQNALRRDRDVRRERFTVTVNVWVSGSGAVTRADLVDGSGDSERDRKIIAALSRITGLRRPQEGMRFPQRTIVRGANGF